jgi:hypothetical protein
VHFFACTADAVKGSISLHAALLDDSLDSVPQSPASVRRRTDERRSVSKDDCVEEAAQESVISSSAAAPTLPRQPPIVPAKNRDIGDSDAIRAMQYPHLRE